jgi:mono/diheme cytochrome c family protein
MDIPISHIAKILLCFWGVSGCVPGQETDQSELRTDALYGKGIFAVKCSQCHGPSAQGAGPASLGLGAAPPDLTRLAQRNDGAFPRNYVMGVIDGYSQRDHPTAAMPEFGAEGLGQTVIVEDNGIATPVPADLLALANYLESIQQ